MKVRVTGCASSKRAEYCKFVRFRFSKVSDTTLAIPHNIPDALRVLYIIRCGHLRFWLRTESTDLQKSLKIKYLKRDLPHCHCHYSLLHQVTCPRVANRDEIHVSEWKRGGVVLDDDRVDVPDETGVDEAEETGVDVEAW